MTFSVKTTEVDILKNAVKIFASLIIVSFLCACSESAFVDFGTFFERFCESENSSLSFSDVLFSEKDGGKEYVFSPSKGEDGEEKTVIRLFSNSGGKLYECRVIFPKLLENGKPMSRSQGEKENFQKICENALSAFSGFSFEKSEAALSELEFESETAFSKSFEKTKKERGIYLVALSNEAVTELVIYNSYLHEIEETQKPESRLAFDKTTNVRTETVPHR